MIRPFKGMFAITQEWGNDLVINGVHIYAQFGLKGHNGVDYGCPEGTPIYAPHNGKVIEAAFDKYGYGMYVKIENDKEGSILGHLKSFVVNPGDVITEGTQIGLSDNTGNSTGAHLHWGYFRKPRNKSDGYSGTTNPYPYLQDQTPTESIEILKQKIEDMKQTEIRLKNEKEALQTEMTNKLALKEKECLQKLQDYKTKVANLTKTFNEQITSI